MSFGRNPHVAKAQAAEQKAANARDASAYEQAWREAARLWDRAAERESDEKRQQQYTQNAEQAREQADSPRAVPQVEVELESVGQDDATSIPSVPVDHATVSKRLLN
jgi:hypothetical protein